jgi:hypothetical protein
MKIAGPERYKLCFDADKFAVTCSRGTPKFSGLATRKLPKFYVVSLEHRLRVPKTPSDLKINKISGLRNAFVTCMNSGRRTKGSLSFSLEQRARYLRTTGGQPAKLFVCYFYWGFSSPCPSRRITKISLRRRIALTRIAFFRSIRVELFFLWGHLCCVVSFHASPQASCFVSSLSSRSAWLPWRKTPLRPFPPTSSSKTLSS